MPCYTPLKGFRTEIPNQNGNFPIKITGLDHGDRSIELPCNRCIGCRLERSRQWAIRCIHEAQTHDENTFITLTYDKKNLPPKGSLQVADLQKFFKRLRKNTKKSFRYYACGEYGEKYARPHYHAILFGIAFPDRQYHSEKNGQVLYTSQELVRSWKKGFSSVGDVTFESAAYVARYVMKKITGEKSYETYQSCDEQTGELRSVIPEYQTQSLKPGLGNDWYKKYKNDLYPDDFVIIKGKKMKVPKYYDLLYQAENPAAFEVIKERRQAHAMSQSDDSSPERLYVREQVKSAQLRSLKRNYENGT